jgi:enoyl-CoA hydratase/carnithine racemase
MVFKSLTLEVRDRVAYATFTTPEKLNSISEDRIADLAAVVAHVRNDSRVRALTLTGSGRAFCVGLDLGLLKRAFDDMAYFESVVRRLQAVLLDLEALPVPVVAAVNGITRAGGFELMIACDLVVVADEAKIGDRHTNLGLLPGGGLSPRLPRLVGEQRAKAIIMLAQWMTGTEAAACGLALRSVPGEQLTAAVEDLMQELRHRPRECMAGIKRSLFAARTLDTKSAVQVEIQNFIAYMGGLPYAREGYEASLAGREPDWY